MSKSTSKNNRKKILTIGGFIVALVALIIIDLSIGSSTNITQEIIINLRLPHTLCAVFAGCGLAVVGCMLQSTLSNPLASASTIGISQGASAGACVAIVFFGNLGAWGSLTTTALLAFVFALIPTILIFVLTKMHTLSSTAIILCGVAMSIFFGGFVALVEYFADSSKVADVVFWTFGSLRNVDAQSLTIIGITTVITIIYAIAQSINLNAYESGDLLAHSVGINVNRNRTTNLIVCAICSAMICAFCGTINFIGLIAPHIMRKLIGANYKVLIPTSAVCGAALLLFSDIVSSVVIPGAILPIGAITSLIGAPIFMLVLLKGRKWSA